MTQVTPLKPTVSPQAGPKPDNKTNWRPRHRFTVFRAVVALIVLLLIGGVVVSVGIYRKGWTGGWVNHLVNTVPFPVARINWHFIPLRDFQGDVDTLTYFYSNQAPPIGKPSKTFVEKAVLTKLINDAWLEIRSRQNGVVVSSGEVGAEYERIVRQSGGEAEAGSNIRKLYNWTSQQFKFQVVRPFVLRQKMRDRLVSDPTFDASNRSRADAVLGKARHGEDFTDLAKRYSEDSTASRGGDLGFFKKGDMVVEFQTAVEQLKPGEISGLVRTQYGYHIIKLEEKKTNGDVVQWHARHILIKSEDVDAWLKDQLKKVMVVLYWRGLHWEAACAAVLENGEQCPVKQSFVLPESGALFGPKPS